MGVPKKHKTRSGRDQRRSHHHLDKLSLAVCKNCKAPVRPHQVCSNCGHYKDRKTTTSKVASNSKLKAKADNNG